MTTAALLLMELQTWCCISDDEIKAAEESGVNEYNNPAFAQLVEDWGGGVYDEDPDQLVNEIQSLY